MTRTASAPASGRLVRFLQNPNSYPHGPRAVRLVQTHASWVFIAPPFVYKVKKPVNFGFLDFSTLEKRHHAAEREVALNRRLCPDIYLGVVPISRQGRGLVLGPGTEVVEYAVWMRQLSDRGFLDRRLARGGVTPADLDRVATTLAAFYRAHPPTADIEAWGRVDRLRISTDENFRQTAAFLGRTLSHPAFEAIRFYTNEFYRRTADLFDRRVRGGWIRDCHGDLHAEHVHITPNALHIFDCIEFNDRFRYVDVASDVAFLAMDLDYQGRPDLARHFVGRMSAALSDPDLERLMDFYKCYRAYVRGKVESLHSIANGVPGDEGAHSADRARRYFRLALQYALAGSQPMVLVLMGRIATGKSALATVLREELGWDFVSSDRVRKDLAGVPLLQRGDATARARLYSARMTQRTYARLLAVGLERLRQGHGIILDATYGRRADRDRLRAGLRRAGFDGVFVEAQAGDVTVQARLRARELRADQASDARMEDFQALSRLYEPPRELPPAQLIHVNTDRPLDDTLVSLFQQMVDRGGRATRPPAGKTG